ncbi:TIR domain-containing protein [Bradyrhizobium japonicum]|uniref:TIR domain-containing protein n=1 Tax=Bradyrhizobium japonicum TaxID=375 RepID=UPI0009B8857E|nr:TIR domain-containing protein [Bradyrhizobium japonicum]MCS3540615.1 hypothetical protein [Bradyrhizobium japonicum]MCS4208995.1 hypothetical protein [Bradyrhizobium japonicum]MYV83013.1 hypothetical protein [Bradyrhizobium japonicum]
MARRTFFSFHYKPDVQRAQIVKNSWVTREREDAGFFDSSAFEAAKRTNDDTLKAFLIREMHGSSVVCILVGKETAHRRWVRYEIQRGIWDERGILAVRIHTIRHFTDGVTTPGPNPLDLLGIHIKRTESGKSARFIERSSVIDGWSYSSDFGQVIPKWPYGALPSEGSHALSSIFPIYDWAADGFNQLGGWLDKAATQAGR